MREGRCMSLIERLKQGSELLPELVEFDFHASVDRTSMNTKLAYCSMQESPEFADGKLSIFSVVIKN